MAIEKSFIIGAKRVTVICDLTFYSEKDYKGDFKDFLNYQTRKEKIAPDQPSRKDFKFFNLKEFKFIPFNDFLKIVTDLLSKVISQILREDPSIMVSDQNEFKVKFIIFRVPGRMWYFEEDLKEELKGEEYAPFLEELESEVVEHHNYLTAGVFLIQALPHGIT